MKLLVCYDIETLSRKGRRRLRAISQLCKEYGIRLQLSIYECEISPSQKDIFSKKLFQMIEPTTDKLTLIELHVDTVVAHYGVKSDYDKEWIL